MTPREHHAAALALLDAEATRRQIGLLSLAYPGMTLDDADAVQAELVALKRATGRRGVGWEIGPTPRARRAGPRFRLAATRERRRGGR